VTGTHGVRGRLRRPEAVLQPDPPCPDAEARATARYLVDALPGGAEAPAGLDGQGPTTRAGLRRLPGRGIDADAAAALWQRF
jgi:hypothetical protein